MSALTVYNILSQAATAVRDSTAIASWLTTNLPGQTLTIYVGEDRVDPPGEEQAPFVILTPAMTGFDLGSGTDERRPAFDVDWGIVVKTATTTTATGKPNIITQDGLTKSDAFGLLVLAAIKYSFGAMYVYTANYALSGAAPLWEGGVTITLKYDAGLTTEPTL